MSDQSIIWDEALIQKYNISGPRYTSYPTALEFSSLFQEDDFLTASQRYPTRPLSLYIHIPFCRKLCYFCGCNKIITRHPHKADIYIEQLSKEIALRASLFKHRSVIHMHWGGGTPTFLSTEQISRLMQQLRTHFNFSTNAELSIEIAPSEIALSMLDHLRHEGFNRLSMGVQDFSKKVQRMINREESEQRIFNLINHAKTLGFHSTNIDLIYGLPKQSISSFKETLEKIIILSPDRLSVFNYAHLPDRFASQRKIKTADLPSAQEKLTILQQTIDLLTNAGYQFIGMDHFAKVQDKLAIAQRNKQLNRNFQGYTTDNNTDLLGLGLSAISLIGDSYAQNEKILKKYYTKLNAQQSPLWQGLTMTLDDCIRRDVIKALICHFTINYSEIERNYPIDVKDYFSEDLQLLAPLVADELVTINKRQITVTAKGRLFIRNICLCFDRYLRQQAKQQRFSRVI